MTWHHFNTLQMNDKVTYACTIKMIIAHFNLDRPQTSHNSSSNTIDFDFCLIFHVSYVLLSSTFHMSCFYPRAWFCFRHPMAAAGTSSANADHHSHSNGGGNHNPPPTSSRSKNHSDRFLSPTVPVSESLQHHNDDHGNLLFCVSVLVFCYTYYYSQLLHLALFALLNLIYLYVLHIVSYNL